MRKCSKVLSGLFFLVLLIVACGDEPTAVPIPDAVATLTPTANVAPTIQAVAKPTLEPVPTVIATARPAPTATPVPATPTSTPVPATLTPTPVPPTEVPVETQAATDGDLFIQLVEPADLETVSNEATFRVVGRTRIDAIVTVNDTIVEPDIEGTFSSTVDL
jgi:hypothetical protein